MRKMKLVAVHCDNLRVPLCDRVRIELSDRGYGDGQSGVLSDDEGQWVNDFLSRSRSKGCPAHTSASRIALFFANV